MLAVLFLFALPAFGWESDLKFPPPAPVVDQFGLLSGADNSQISGWLRDIKARSGVEISVFIPSSLEGREIADFSIQAAEAWKLGRKKEDKALLFVIAPKERKMRLEVGYGLEGEITDAFSRHVLDDEMRPYFREGRYAEGIAAALTAVNERIPLSLSQEMRQQPRRRSGADVLRTVVFIIIILLFVFFRLFGFLPLYAGRGYYGGGSGGGWRGGRGGSSWGGGGGGFGGGGASSSW